MKGSLIGLAIGVGVVVVGIWVANRFNIGQA